jgi:phage repressor protein C with HTH and peptisase S24 domain
MRIKKLLTRFFKLPLFLAKVSGESAWPVLVPGKRYLATALLNPKKGDFIIFRNPKVNSEVYVKKVEEIKDGAYRVNGLVSWSSSSNDFGLVDKNLVLGKIL